MDTHHATHFTTLDSDATTEEGGFEEALDPEAGRFPFHNEEAQHYFDDDDQDVPIMTPPKGPSVYMTIHRYVTPSRCSAHLLNRSSIRRLVIASIGG
jgi:hypothetical protein